MNGIVQNVKQHIRFGDFMKPYYIIELEDCIDIKPGGDTMVHVFDSWADYMKLNDPVALIMWEKDALKVKTQHRFLSPSYYWIRDQITIPGIPFRPIMVTKALLDDIHKRTGEIIARQAGVIRSRTLEYIDITTFI